VATGMLAGRCFRQPRIGFIVWTAATLGLTIALAAQSMGFASGFGPATFRAVQVFALLLAPLWLAWGLVEVAVTSEGARFGVRLISSALTVVATVILATDPLTAQPFSKAWPLTGTHFQPVARDALDVVQAVAVVVAVATASLAAVRASRGSGPPVTAIVPVALAVLMTAGQRLPLPTGAAYPLLSMMAAALVWFAVSRMSEPSRRAAARGGSSDGSGEGVRNASGKPGDDYWSDDRVAGDYVPEGQYVTYGQGQPGNARPRGDFPGGPAARPAPDGDRGRRPGPPPPPEPAAAAAAATRPYGRILIFTLLDDRVAEFDRLAEDTAEHVRTGEPDTLVYVIHLVPNAPMQRIFYEIYRDRAAFDSHESQPYMQRFVAERRACVLATNVIELRLKYAKVAPLPSPAGGPRGPQAAPGRARPLPPARPQRSDQPRYGEPRYDEPRYDERYDQTRYDERRPDQRQVPSGRPYGG
jgi:quinol monooxygenase YgiN